MKSYQVPKIGVDVELLMQDSVELKGRIFISQNILSYTGKPRLEDFLNQSEVFFPFQNEAGGYALINKGQLILLRSSELDSEELEKEMMLKPVNITVFLEHTQPIEAVFYPNLPEGQRRALDFLNQKERFLPIYQGDKKIIVSTHHILYCED